MTGNFLLTLRSPFAVPVCCAAHVDAQDLSLFTQNLV